MSTETPDPAASPPGEAPPAPSVRGLEAWARLMALAIAAMLATVLRMAVDGWAKRSMISATLARWLRPAAYVAAALAGWALLEWALGGGR